MRSFFYRLFIFLLIVIAALAILVAALPSILSSDWGNKRIESLINRYIPGKVAIRSLQISWNSHQIIEGITLRDPEGEPVANFEKFYTEASLWQLIKGSTQLGKTYLHNLNASIVTDQSGISNLQKAVGSGPAVGSLPPLDNHPNRCQRRPFSEYGS